MSNVQLFEPKKRNSGLDGKRWYFYFKVVLVLWEFDFLPLTPSSRWEKPQLTREIFVFSWNDLVVVHENKSLIISDAACFLICSFQSWGIQTQAPDFLHQMINKQSSRKSLPGQNPQDFWLEEPVVVATINNRKVVIVGIDDIVVSWGRLGEGRLIFKVDYKLAWNQWIKGVV